MSDEDDEDVEIGLAGQAEEQSQFSSDELAGAGSNPSPTTTGRTRNCERPGLLVQAPSRLAAGGLFIRGLRDSQEGY